jgi:hypothetical protein
MFSPQLLLCPCHSLLSFKCARVLLLTAWNLLLPQLLLLSFLVLRMHLWEQGAHDELVKRFEMAQEAAAPLEAVNAAQHAPAHTRPSLWSDPEHAAKTAQVHALT